MYVSIKEIVSSGTATFAVNIPDLRFSYWILKAAQFFNQPIILQISERVLKAEGPPFLKLLIRQADAFSIPCSVHIDHCKSIDLCKLAIDNGASGVLYDGGGLSLMENIRNTQQVVEYGKRAEVYVEGEISAIPGEEDGHKGLGAQWVSIDDTVQYVEESGVFSFAPFFGNFHGHYSASYRGFDLDYLTSIKNAIGVPLVIHGGSGISKEIAQQIMKCDPGKINFSTDFKTALQSSVAGVTDPYLAGKELEEKVFGVLENLRTIWV